MDVSPDAVAGIDLNDQYLGGPQATNGGARRGLANGGLTLGRDVGPGVGFLFDVGGRDSYTAGAFGTNGGADQQADALQAGPIGGIGMLIDAGFSFGDVYSDTISRTSIGGLDWFGTGSSAPGSGDCTKVPKGPLGMQIDDTPVVVNSPMDVETFIDRCQDWLPVLPP